MKVAEVARGHKADLRDKIRAILKRQAADKRELGEALKCPASVAAATVQAMMASGLAITRRGDGKFILLADLETGGRHALALTDRGDGWMVLGLTADNHLGSKHYRSDVLHGAYDRFAEEGVTHVLNGGNWIEGEARFNRHDVKIYGLSAQVDYLIEEYPQRKGVTTHFVAGDDHEGWYVQRELLDIGRYVEDRAKAAGRNDLHYLGYMEADISLRQPKGSNTLRLQHGGGGSAYALSYTLQKMVESFQGGEKPAILVEGHHHKFAYVYVRNVHAIMPGCTQDQSMFMRKRKIEAHVGAVLLWLKQAKDGVITNLRVEWLPSYDRGFYERRFDI